MAKKIDVKWISKIIANIMDRRSFFLLILIRGIKIPYLKDY